MSRHQQRADTYFAAGDYPKAEIEYLNAFRLDSSNPHTVSRLGVIYYEEGRLRSAYGFVRRACELSTNDLDLHVKLGTIYLEIRKFKEARDEAEFILERSPTNADAPVILAESISSHLEIDQTQKRLEKLSKQVGNTAPLELAFAIVDYLSGDQKGTEAALRRSVALDPKYSAAYYTLGNLYTTQNKLKDADAAFKTAADLAPLRSPRRLSYANFKIQTGDLAEGKRLLAEITKGAPDYLPAWIREAEIALAEKKYDDCDSLLNQALARDTDNYEAMFLRGRLFLAQGQPEKAVAQFDRMSALYDRAAEVHYQLAVAHLAVNDPVKASADLNQALFLRPKYAEAVVLLAGLNLNKGDTTSAISALTQLIEQQPSVGEAYVMLANAYVMQKNYDQALSVYGKLAQLYPKNPQVPFLSGLVLMQKKNRVEARKSFEKALALSPKFVLALEQLVNLDLGENQFTAALDRVNKQTDDQLGVGRYILLAKIHMARATSIANKNKPGGAEAKLNTPATQDDVNQAEASLLKAIDLSPTRDTPYLILAQLYVSAGKEQAALERLNGLIAKTNNAAVYMEIGAIHDALKDYPKARDAYEKVIDLRPDFVPALNNLSYLYAERLGEPDKALPLAEKAREISHEPSTADTLGWIVYQKGDYLRARGLIEESASKLASQPEVQYHLGMVRYMSGEEEAARAPLQLAASSAEDFPGKDQAARHLAILAVDPKTADAKTQADLEKDLQQEPNDPVAANRLGAIYERAGASDRAVKTYEQSLKQNPQNSQIMARLAHLYLSLNQSDKALEIAKDAHKLAPDDAVISCLLGRLVFQSGDYNWAASLLQEAAPRLPDQPEVQYDLAWSYYSVGRVNEAERTMQAAAPGLTAARQADARQFLALLAAAKSPTPAAQAQSAQILNTNSEYVPAIMVSAAQAEQSGKADDAIKLYQKALAHYPSFSPAARNLAILCAEHPGDDDQKAYDLGVKARAAYPDDMALERAVGMLAYRRGEYARAVQLLQDSSQTLNKDGELFYYLGMAHYQLKHSPQSKAALQHALTLNIQSKSADDARKVLAELK